MIIERRGVRYTVSVHRPKRQRRARSRIVTVLDDAVAEGQWTWDTTAKGGVRFRGRRA